MNLRTGLVSVSFRKLDVPQIVALAKENGLAAIEWGGDIHVKPGDLPAAYAARTACEQAGIIVSAYGSYYSAGHTPPAEWEAVLASARELKAESVRIWAGKLGSAAASEADWQRTVDDINRICESAAGHGISITIEYHGGTLTDTLESALKLYGAISHPNFRAGWQPRDSISAEDGANEIRALRPWLGNVHVFQWWPTGATRHPLADGRERWQTYLNAIAEDGVRRTVLLEFFKDDSPDQMRADAKTLHEMLRKL